MFIDVIVPCECMQKPTTRVPSVQIAWRTFGRTLRHGYENLGNLFVLGVFWYIGAALIVTLGPASAALHRITKPMTEERAASYRTFLDRFLADWRWSSVLVWLLLGVLFLLDINRQFYAGAVDSILPLFSILFFVIEIIWFMIMLVAMPLALRQEEQRLRITLRNAAIIVFANLPGIALSTILLFLTSLVLLVLPPLFLLVPGYVALWTEENVRLLLVASGHLPEDEFADRPFRWSVPRRTPKKPTQRRG
jgi:uncharacterized membrane protein YesL